MDKDAIHNMVEHFSAYLERNKMGGSVSVTFTISAGTTASSGAQTPADGATQGSTAEPRPVNADPDVKRVTGIIERFRGKQKIEGSDRKYKPYCIMLGGEWYSTFDDKVGQRLTVAEHAKQRVEIYFKQEGDFKNIKDVDTEVGEKQKPQEKTSGKQDGDDCPF